MKNISIIMRREFTAYFNSPIAYIFIVLFLLLSSAIFITTYFLSEICSMRMFWGTAPYYPWGFNLAMIFFIPAITMRLWAEDRKSGSLALLQSLPMKPYELVIGKFLGSYLFYLVTLAGTLIIPIMLFLTGDPDPGPIVGGYIGAILLGAFYLSMGLFISSLFKDQIVAFMVTVVAALVFYELGTDFFASIIDAWINNAGSFIQTAAGVPYHFASIERGVIDLRDVFFFLSFTVVFLALNAYAVEGLMRRYVTSVFYVVMVLFLALGLAANGVVNLVHLGRFDLTEGRIYTVSDAAKNIISRLKDAPVTVRFYISPKEKLPSAMKNIQQEVTDKLREFQMVSDRFRFEVINPTLEEETITKLREVGVQPFDAQSIERDAFGIRRIFSAITISYLDKADEVIPQIVPQNLPLLEYELLSRIVRMTQTEPIQVAIYAPKEMDPRLDDPRMREYMRQMGRDPSEQMDNYKNISEVLRQGGYEVRRVGFDVSDPLPASVRTLIVANPKRLNKRQVYEIAKFLAEGGNVVLAAQEFSYEYNPDPSGGVRVTPRRNRPGVNDLLANYGLTLSEDILMDQSNEILSIPTRASIGGLFTAMIDRPVRMPIQLRVTADRMNKDVSITNGVSSLLYLWGSAILVDKQKVEELNLEVEPVLQSSENTWMISPKSTPLTPEDVNPEFHDMLGPQNLALLVTGQFPNPFEGETVPKWPGAPDEDEEEDEPVEEWVSAPGKLLVIGCAEMFSDRALGAFSNAIFFRNSVDALSQGDDLINVRAKLYPTRYIKEVSVFGIVVYSLLAIAFVPLVVTGLGILRFVLRRISRETYLKNLEAAS